MKIPMKIRMGMAIPFLKHNPLKTILLVLNIATIIGITAPDWQQNRKSVDVIATAESDGKAILVTREIRNNEFDYGTIVLEDMPMISLIVAEFLFAAGLLAGIWTDIGDMDMQNAFADSAAKHLESEIEGDSIYYTLEGRLIYKTDISTKGDISQTIYSAKSVLRNIYTSNIELSSLPIWESNQKKRSKKIEELLEDEH
jgi:hypothetical protein